MCTHCVRTAEKAAVEWMRDPAWAAFMISVYERMNDGYYRPEYIELAVAHGSHKGGRGNYSMADAVIFLVFFTMLGEGEILSAIVETPEKLTPYPDRCKDKNNAILRGLRRPFHSEFTGGVANEADGSFGWKEPIVLARTLDDGENVTKEYHRATPMEIPLEVGSISTYNTFHRLLVRKTGIARWPYESANITVLIRPEHVGLSTPGSVYDRQDNPD